ncbi:hypothetical protein [Allocoleopsis sp.]|uniref:hypothetical protein n=1 Tax=Allocoleopsis sp. TaxID=3088169 RepID=UPI002FD711C3
MKNTNFINNLCEFPQLLQVNRVVRWPTAPHKGRSQGNECWRDEPSGITGARGTLALAFAQPLS